MKKEGHDISVLTDISVQSGHEMSVERRAGPPLRRWAGVAALARSLRMPGHPDDRSASQPTRR